MATLSSGSTITFGVQGDQTITLDTSAGTEGTLSWNAPNGVQVQTMGPMPLSGKVIRMNGVSGAATLVSKTGVITYTVSASQLPAYVSDAAGSATGLAGPNGATFPLQSYSLPNLAIVGDSRAAQAFTDTGTGGLHNYQRKPNGFGSWVDFLTQQRIAVSKDYCKAVSSSLVSEVAGQLAQVFALSPSPSHVAILTGTNTFAAGTSAATAWAQLVPNIAACISRGIQPIIIFDLPRQLSTWTAANARQSFQFNQIVRSNAGLYGALVVDPTQYLADSANSNGDPLSNYYYDGIHPATMGGYYIGKAIADLISPLLPAPIAGFASNGDTYNATDNPYGNILQNGLFTGTAGTNTSSGGAASGTVASLWNNRTLTGTGTSVASIVARSDGKPGNWQQLVLTSTGTSTYRFSLITAPPVNTYYARGDRLALALDLDVSSATGLEVCTISLSDYDGGSTIYDATNHFASTLISATYYPMPTAFAGRVHTDPITTGAGSNGLLVRGEFQVKDGAATIKIGGAELRRI